MKWSTRVDPLFKKNSRSEVGNYRPQSILTTISKVFERVVYEQVEDYIICFMSSGLDLEQRNLLSPHSSL